MQPTGHECDLLLANWWRKQPVTGSLTDKEGIQGNHQLASLAVIPRLGEKAKHLCIKAVNPGPTGAYYYHNHHSDLMNARYHYPVNKTTLIEV